MNKRHNLIKDNKGKYFVHNGPEPALAILWATVKKRKDKLCFVQSLYVPQVNEEKNFKMGFKGTIAMN